MRKCWTLASLIVTVTLAGLSHADGPVTAKRTTTMFGPSFIIDKQNQSGLAAAIEYGNRSGATITLSPDVSKGRLPVLPNTNTRIIDLRYGTGLSVIRGNHPRLEGMWPQYSNLNTGLRKNIVVSDVVPYDASVESWKGEFKPVNPENKNRTQTSSEFANTHNHYQNLLSEVWSFSPTVNAVALWGDSGAFYPGARSWGGFLSARSWPVHWGEYLPPGTPNFEDKDFDAALVGLEVDVLNNGMPQGTVSKQVGIPLSKIGVQVVGFGKTNTAAVELRSEDSDDGARKVNERRGTWHYGIIEHNALNQDSTFLITTTPTSKTGLDMSRTRFTDSAIKINSDGAGTGIGFSHSGEFYSQGDKLVTRIGVGGLSIVSPQGKEIVAIDKDGQITWHGVNISSPALYKIPLFMLIVLLAMAAILWKFVRELRVAQRQLDAMRLAISAQPVQS